jgi:hypothetical protein
VIDPIRERRPPFSTDDVVIEFAALLKSYGVRDVTGRRPSQLLLKAISTCAADRPWQLCGGDACAAERAGFEP